MSTSGKTDGGRRKHSPRLPFALVVFFTLASSFGVARLLATLIVPPRRVPFVSSPVSALQGIASVEQAGKENEGGESFYRTIIENNLFRPLGWTPPRPQEPYRLLGTITPIDTKPPPKAIIQNTVRNQTHIVTIGDTFDTDTHVTDIQTKHVTVKKKRQQRKLTLKSSFLQRR